MTTIYNLTVDDGDRSRDYQYADKALAVAEAKNRFNDGAFSVGVSHYTNNGNNCMTDYYRERNDSESGQFGMGT